MDQAAKDIAGAAAYLSDLEAVASPEIGAVGFCMGGSLALWSATVAENVQAAVGFYPAVPWERMNPTWPSYAGKAAMIHCSEEDGTSSAPGIRTAVSRSRRRAATSRSSTTRARSTRSSTTTGPRCTTRRRRTPRGPAPSTSSTPGWAEPLGRKGSAAADRLRHPATGEAFASPVPPGSGWPGDPATPRTPVAHSPDDVARLAASARDLAALEARESVCRACPRLVAWREEVARTRRRAFADEPYWGRPVAGFGDRRAWLLVVGLAPAAHGGNRTGRVFTGDRSGDWIFAALHRAGFAAQEHSVHAADGQVLVGDRIAAAVRCPPPGNAPTPAERDACAPWLDREIALLAPGPRVVLALGAFAWDAALAAARRQGWVVPRPRPRFGHGAEVVLDRLGGRAPVVLVGSFHVSQQNTFTGRLTEAMLDAVLARVRAVGESG